MAGSRIGSFKLQDMNSRFVLGWDPIKPVAIFIKTDRIVVINDSQLLRANVWAAANYLDDLSVVYESISMAPEIKRKAKCFLVHNDRLVYCSNNGIRFELDIQKRRIILQGLHDDDGHWDFYSIY